MKLRHFFCVIIILFIHIAAWGQTQVDLQADVRVGCAPLKVTFQNASVYEAGVSYIWNFGTGAPPVESQEKTRQIVYETPGLYLVSLTASGSLGKITDTLYVRVFAPPVANFSYYVRGCVPTVVDYANSSTQGDADIIEYKWNFGDGKYYYTQNYSKEYIAEALYESYLKVTDGNGCTSELTQDVSVYNRPSSAFKLDTNFSCNPPLRVNATLTESAKSWVVYEWDFSTGTTFIVPNPNTVSYTQKGAYTITAKASAGNTCYSQSSQTVLCGTVASDFAMYYGKMGQSVMDNQAVTPGKFMFKALSPGNFYYSWIINGVTYTQDSPEVLFCVPGIYQVELITGSNLPCPISKTKTLRIVDPSANSIVLNQLGVEVLGDVCAGSFELISPFVGAQNTWTVDGVVRNGESVQYSLCTPGTYTIQLHANFESYCSFDVQRTITVVDCHAQDVVLRANGETFTAGSPEVCRGYVQFALSKQSIGAPEWIIDGNQYNEYNPQLQICTIGTHTVTVSGTNYYNCPFTTTQTFTTKKCFSTDFALKERDGAEFYYPNDTMCVNITFEVVPDNKEYFERWLSPVDTKAGFYFYTTKPEGNTIVMESKTQDECIDTVINSYIIENVEANFDYSRIDFACPFPAQIDFVNTSKQATWYQWFAKATMGDSVLFDYRFSTDVEPKATFNGGYFEQDSLRHTVDKIIIDLQMEATNKYGCKDTLKRTLVKEMPLANILPDKAYGCVLDSITFESRDIAGYDYVDSVIVFDPLQNKNRKIGRRVYNPIEHIYYDFGDGTIEHYSGAEISSFAQDVQPCFLNSITLTQTDIDSIQSILLQQEGIGEYYVVMEYFKLMYPKKYLQFVNCVKAQKYLSKRMVKHAYTQPGVYYAKQIVIDSNGCVDTSYVIEVRIGEKDPSLDFTVSSPTVCPYNTISFIGTSAIASKIDSWHYMSKDLQIESTCGEGASPEYEINPVKSGPAKISLRVSYNGCTTVLTKNNAVEVFGPVGHVSFDIPCSTPLDYTFNEEIYGADTWTWDFGDGVSEDNTSNPTHHYSQSGDYVMKLTMYNATSGCAPYVFSKKVMVRQIESLADYNKTFCPAFSSEISPLISEDYNTTGNFEPFVWYFDGKAYRRGWDTKQPILSDSKDTIKGMLVAVDENRCIDTLEFTIIAKYPKAAITADKTFMCGTQDSVTFTFANSDTTITQWRWSFGDNTWEVRDTSDTSSSTTHTYRFTNDRQFSVMLSVDDDNGCFTNDTLTIHAYYKSANYTMPDFGICYNVDSAFFIAMNADLDSSLWLFGDGDEFKTNDFRASHYYATEGEFTAYHVGYYHSCVDSVAKKVVVGTPIADFFTLDTIACTRNPVKFQLSQPLDYARGIWTFPETNPFTYLDSVEYYTFYSAGRKDIVLELEFGTCHDVDTFTVLVNKADFKTINPRICVDNSVQFVNNIIGIADSLHWFFGDGTELVSTQDTIFHEYTDRGMYNVQLVSYKTGCYDTIIMNKAVSVQKVDADFWLNDSIICRGDEVQFLHTNTIDAEWGRWYFDAINSTEYVANDTMFKPYTKVGSVVAKLVLESSNGCVDTDSVIIQVNGAEGDFHVNPAMVCKGDDVGFYIDYLTNVVDFTWFFGDGDIGKIDQPMHTYETVGQVPVQLELLDPTGCKNYVSKMVNIIDVRADFTISNQPVCMFESIDFVNTSQQAISWTWNMGNAEEYEDENALHYAYNQSGTFPVSLHVEGDMGCTDVITKDVTILPAPTVSIVTQDSICVGQDLQLVAEHSSITNLIWRANTYPIAYDIDTLAEKPTIDVEYTVWVKNSDGCTNQASYSVYVHQIPQYEVGPLDTLIAIGDTVLPNIIAPAQTIFMWQPQSSDISCTDCKTPKLFPFEDKLYTLTLSDWCFQKNYELHIRVIPTVLMDVPTAFTPNNDGSNDELFVRGWGIKDFVEFKVYNRWGQLLYVSDDMNKGWDGTYKGMAQPMETYTYTAKGISFLGEEISIKGYVTLIR